MIYHDYSHKTGEWISSEHGGQKNPKTIEFLRSTNYILDEQTPGTMTVAEESIDFVGVARPPASDNPSFWFKWSLSWMHGTLDYVKLDPVYRRCHRDKMTSGMLCNYTEDFMLPLPHDGVMRDEKSVLDHMPGNTWQKFVNLRAYYG